jgi:catalase (peroxidase I)
MKSHTEMWKDVFMKNGHLCNHKSRRKWEVNIKINLRKVLVIYEGVSKNFRTGRVERERANGTALCH